MAPSVSVPVLSVHRMSMLPRFSIASSRRTMTPRLLMARAPAESVTLMIAGKQLRRQADRERHGEQQRLDHRAVEQQVHRQHEQNDDDHHADQQIAELANAAREVGLGRARPQPRRDRAELGPAAGLDGEDLRRAAAHRSAEKDGIGPFGKGASGGPSRAASRPGNDSPVMLASLTRKSCASITSPSAGIRLPAESRMRSPGTIALTGTVCSTPSRTTRHVSARRFFSSSTAADARYS